MTDTVSTNNDQAYFDDLVSAATDHLTGSEVLLANISGERTDFIRFNKGDVRQAGTVEQRELSVDLVEGNRHVGGSFTLTGDADSDQARLRRLLETLREQRRLVPEDPFLLYNTEPVTTDRTETGAVPGPDAALADIRNAAVGKDLVGIYASGDTFSGFANSLGQRNWFQSATFNLDWSFYLHADKAVVRPLQLRPTTGDGEPSRASTVSRPPARSTTAEFAALSPVRSTVKSTSPGWL